MISESDMGLLNNIHSLNGGYNKKATHFLDWSNQFAMCFTYSPDDNNTTEISGHFNIQPFILNLNQELINFIINYMDLGVELNLRQYYKHRIKLEDEYVSVYKEDINDIFSETNSDEPKDLYDKYFINNLTINALNITLNYKSSIFDISWKGQSKILNLINKNTISCPWFNN